MVKRILILNGVNLNLLGQREVKVYGTATLADLERKCIDFGLNYSLKVECYQSNSESNLVEHIHAARDRFVAIIINPAAFSHTSIALLDALSAYNGYVIEVHISNIYKREAFRHHSYVSFRADAVMAGFGVNGYVLALRHLISVLD